MNKFELVLQKKKKKIKIEHVLELGHEHEIGTHTKYEYELFILGLAWLTYSSTYTFKILSYPNYLYGQIAFWAYTSI